MSKKRIVIEFDESKAKDAFAIFMGGAWADISSYLKQSLKAEGLESDPSINIDEDNSIIKITVVSSNKGIVLTTPEPNILESKLYEDLENGEKYAIYNNSRIDLFIRKSGGADTFVGAAPSIDSLAKNLFSYEDPSLLEDEADNGQDKPVMELVQDAEIVEEPQSEN